MYNTNRSFAETLVPSGGQRGKGFAIDSIAAQALFPLPIRSSFSISTLFSIDSRFNAVVIGFESNPV